MARGRLCRVAATPAASEAAAVAAEPRNARSPPYGRVQVPRTNEIVAVYRSFTAALSQLPRTQWVPLAGQSCTPPPCRLSDRSGLDAPATASYATLRRHAQTGNRHGYVRSTAAV